MKKSKSNNLNHCASICLGNLFIKLKFLESLINSRDVQETFYEILKSFRIDLYG